MHGRLLRGCLLAILLLLPAGARGHYHQKQIGIEEGLSQPTVSTVVPDNNGNIWIGTRFGLNRYRNGHIKRYIDDNSPSPAITGNQVGFLYMDSQERLWVSTDLGLSLYSESEDAFVRTRTEAVLCAHETPETIYFGGYEGLLLFNKADGTYERKLPEEAVPVILAIYPGADGKLLLVSRSHGLYLYEPGSSSWQPVPLAMEAPGQMILQSILKDGLLYLSSYRQGVYQVNPGTGEILAHWDAAHSGLTFDIVLSMAPFRDHILLGTDGGGICALNPSDGRIQTLPALLGLPEHSFPSSSFTFLHVGTDGSIWAGSVRHGLFCLRETAIGSFRETDGLSENVINDLCLDADGRVWLATDGGGLNVYRPDDGTIGPAKGFSTEIVSSLCPFSDGKLLLSAFSGGLYVYDPASGKKTRFYIMDRENDGKEIQSGYTPSLARSGDYIYIFGASTYCYQLSTRRFYRFPVQEELQGLQGFWADGEGGLLAFSYRQVLRLSAGRMTADALYTVHDSHFINAAARAHDYIWIGTDYGIKYVRDGSDSATAVETPMFNRVTQLQASADNLLWITADHGLFCYDWARQRMETMDESEGFSPQEILCSATSATGSYPLYFGGLGGLVALYGSSRTLSSGPMLIPEFYEASLDGHRVLPSGKALTLPRDYKTFDITVNVPGTDPFSRRPIRYSLEGRGSRVTVSYEDTFPVGMLAPGRYKLRASYLSTDGQWGPEADMLSFRVPEPWYRTWWFLTGMTLMVMGLLAFLLMYLIVRQRERYAQERVRFLTQISHEIRTPLTLIYAPLKRFVSKDPSLEGVFRNVEKMKSITDMVLDRENFPAWSKALEENHLVSLPDEGMPEVNLKPYRILCVEDNPELRDLLITELTPYCKEVRTACDGEAGLEVIRDWQPDVVVSDVMMPRMDGFELCRQVKQDLSISHIPLILLTARADAASVLTGYKAGADSYLAKPFDTALLLQVIGNLMQAREKMRTRFLSPQEQAPSPEEITFTKADEAFLQHLNQFIEAHLDVPEMDVNAIAAEMAMSRASLYNKVKAITGMGVAQYIESIKMRKACALLTSTEMGISEIADALGFTSPRYFSTRFKQATGTNPGAYRKNPTPAPHEPTHAE